jgi:hypothetical protein
MRSFLFLILLWSAAPVWSAPECQPGEQLVYGYFGVDPEVTDLPPVLDFPGAPSGDLLEVQIFWLASENEASDREMTITHYPERTQTDVQLFNAEQGTIDPGLREAGLLESTNFDDGQLDVAFCMPGNRDSGLVFAVYANAGVIAGLQVSPFFIEALPAQQAAPVPLFRTTAVLTPDITQHVAGEFNDATAQNMQENIEQVTGVYPPRYLAESLFQQEIAATFRETLKDAALFHNANENTTIVGNMLLTSNWLGVSAPHSVTRVEMNGVNVLDENNRIDLRNSFIGGLWEIEYGQLAVFVFDEGEQRPALLMNKAPCGGTTAISCETGGTISLFCEPDPLHTIVELWKDDELIEQQHNVEGAVEFEVPPGYCENDWSIRDYTCFRGEFVHSGKRGFGDPRDLPSREFCNFPGYQ